MDSSRKKELRELYKNMRPEMGIIYFECKINNNKYIGYSKNANAWINSLRARLNGDMYISSKNGKLQKDWNDCGEENFIVKVIDTLDYDKNFEKTDYTEELQLLLEEWIKKYDKVEIIE